MSHHYFQRIRERLQKQTKGFEQLSKSDHCYHWTNEYKLGLNKHGGERGKFLAVRGPSLPAGAMEAQAASQRDDVW